MTATLSPATATAAPVAGPGWGRLAALATVVLALLFGLGYLALALGAPILGPADLWAILAEGGGARIPRLVVTELRLPRLLLAALAGAGLALAGVLLQDALRNPLGGPELLGVAAGASVVVAAIIVFRLPTPFWLLPPLALLGGLLSGATVVLSTRRTASPLRLILIGAALAALLNALVIAIISLGDQQDIQVLYQYLLGSLAGRQWSHLQLAAPWLLIGIPLALLCARPLNLLGLGDELAAGLGLPVLPTRLGLTLLAAALVAAVVAVCGPIGFVALLAPHLARRLLGTTDARRVLPAAALLGALLLVAADLAARQLFFPMELPVGIWTTAIGGPVLLLLLRRHLKGRRA